MSEKTAALKILSLLGLVVGLAASPLSLKAQESAKPSVQSGQSPAKARALSTAIGNQTTQPKGEPTAAQLAMRDRRVKCGAEWRATKEKGVVEEGMTWPKYWSACNKRLKEQGA